LLITPPGALDDVLAPWLLGNVEGRHAVGRTAFGELLVFRDLRARAREAGLPDADQACDVALVDVHLQRMQVLAWSVEAFLERLADPAFRREVLRSALVAGARKRMGPLADGECYAFVPALALGGSERLASVERLDWRVHQELLRQL